MNLTYFCLFHYRLTINLLAQFGVVTGSGAMKLPAEGKAFNIDAKGVDERSNDTVAVSGPSYTVVYLHPNLYWFDEYRSLQRMK